MVSIILLGISAMLVCGFIGYKIGRFVEFAECCLWLESEGVIVRDDEGGDTAN